MTLDVGTRLGPHEILAPIGAGGMGEVYKAKDTRLGRIVAIKVLPEHLADSPERRQQFEREAKAISKLNHPHICTLYDIGSQDGIDFLVMEYIEGETLGQRLEQGALPIEEALEHGRQIAEGLDKAHAAGIVHRDLKPGNVMLTSSGVKILDFGIAKQLATGDAAATDLTTMSDTAHDMRVVGTAPYMSPEQAVGRPVDYLSDQFSFGALLYEMLCGQRPFQGDSVATILSAILRDVPPSPRSVRPETPRGIEAVVQRCLEKHPEERYSSTSELSDELRRCERRLTGMPKGLTMSRRALAPVVAASAIAVGIAAWIWLRDDVVRWMERDTLAEVTRLTETGEIAEAWRLARHVHARIPDDPTVRKMVERITLPISIVTDPPGAEVHVQAYASEDAPWVRLGQTPLQGVRIPYALTRWRITKEGYETFDGAPFGSGPMMAFAQGFTLDPEGTRPEGMVRVPGGPFERVGFPAVELDDYWLDRYEVTNREFKEFVDAGGYQNEELWTEPFIQDGRELSRDEAMAVMVDATGRPGPAGWELGAYGEGEADFPVGGVSWYEAAVYCGFAGKSLPTLVHWSAATFQDQLSDIVRFSNFTGDGPARVGSHPGLGDFGTYDMAGNVKEWCWNEGEGGRYILGGAWGEPTYTFKVDADVRPPLSRQPTHGFRCARYETPLEEPLLAHLKPTYFAVEAVPASDELFEAYRRMYAYDRADPEAAVDSVDDSSPYWRKETVSYKAAYGGERVIAHLFLPRDVAPPYQPVIWFPGNDVFFLPAGETLASPYLFDFIPRGGRALVYPVYKGTYERHVPFSFALNEWRDMLVMWSKDLGRTVDYLEERPDIDADKLAYYGFSSGAVYGPVFTAVDERFKASILLAGGIEASFPPEAHNVNFAPRSRVPTLMINGIDDFLNPYEISQEPLFRLLGAPEDDKRHARLEGGHIVPDRLALIEEVLSWLDRYLGPVEATSSTDG